MEELAGVGLVAVAVGVGDMHMVFGKNIDLVKTWFLLKTWISVKTWFLVKT